MRLKLCGILLFAIAVYSLIPAEFSFADTVFLSNNTTADGMILSDQPDFILLYNKETYWRMIIHREFIVKIDKNDKGTKTKDEKGKKEGIEEEIEEGMEEGTEEEMEEISEE